MDRGIPWAVAGGLAAWAIARRGRKDPRLVSDVHAKLDPTRVAGGR